MYVILKCNVDFDIRVNRNKNINIHVTCRCKSMCLSTILSALRFIIADMNFTRRELVVYSLHASV